MLQYKNDNNNKMGRGIFMDEDVLILEDIPSYIKDRWKLVLSMTLTTTIVAAVLSFFIISPKYEAKTKLFIGKESSSEQTQNYNCDFPDESSPSRSPRGSRRGSSDNRSRRRASPRRVPGTR